MILGIDYGSRRIGVAIADPQTAVALPLTVIDGRGDVTRDARNVSDLGIEREATAFVVGLPLNLAGGDSPQTALTRRFAFELERLSGRPVHLQDERLSSDAAEEALDEAGVKGRRRKARIDPIAAQKILQGYLDRGETG